MRVLFLTESYPHQNKQNMGVFVKDQAMALNRHGIRADVVFVEPRSIRMLSLKALTQSHFQIEQAQEDGVFTFRVMGWNPYMNSLKGALVYAWLTDRAIAKYIKQHGKPDVIHVHNTFWAGISAMRASIKYQIPYVLTEHSSRFLLGSITAQMKPWAQKVLSHASLAMGVSAKVCRALEAYGAKQTKVMANVVDTDYFQLPLTPRPQTPFTIIAIGNMTKNKAFDVLLKAFLPFKDRSELRLVFAGSGEQQTRYQVLAEQLGLSNQVTFLGKVGRKEVREALWQANALVLPSYKETFGVVLIEALATGIPVIASRSGGPEDIVNAECGFLFEPGNIQQLTECIEQLLQSQWQEEHLRQSAVTRFSESVLVKGLSEVYHCVVTKQPIEGIEHCQ
ncbi:MAG: hypothetical protein CMK65_01140 [Pseudoalteromonas sp.]|uniref:glycosyltransferase n=1 Tax=Pseudoalteromonas sp. TaxID=53249 RepID=UPI000C909A52|nr:glycosyltransferase [Pseudoalteromonas sp.]MAD02219.1 hypothetical protein [Pseudoalteromonas sp.]|tara:strand:+ start:76349 stop:77527 length:1179 start_codon:yes stop_codon:yes gene_type:complete